MGKAINTVNAIPTKWPTAFFKELEQQQQQQQKFSICMEI